LAQEATAADLLPDLDHLGRDRIRSTAEANGKIDGVDAPALCPAMDLCPQAMIVAAAGIDQSIRCAHSSIRATDRR